MNTPTFYIRLALVLILTACAVYLLIEALFHAGPTAGHDTQPHAMRPAPRAVRGNSFAVTTRRYQPTGRGPSETSGLTTRESDTTASAVAQAPGRWAFSLGGARA